MSKLFMHGTSLEGIEQLAIECKSNLTNIENSGTYNSTTKGLPGLSDIFIVTSRHVETVCLLER